jgi:glycine/D-amino acid oxidase-like deaminating enzyme
MYQATIEEINRTIAICGDSVRTTGVLRAEYTDEGLADCHEHMAALQADGFPVEWYEGPQGTGILMPTDGSFHPLQRAIRFAEHAQTQGATLFENTPALEIGNGVVRTPLATIRARHILVATDGYLMKVVPEASPNVVPVRLQMVATSPAALKWDYPVYARFGYDYWQQRPNGSVLIGGGRDLVRDSEYTDNLHSTQAVREYLEQLLKQLGVSAPITHAWAGIVGYSNSGQPWVRRTSEHVYGIGGYCGTGNVVGTLLARSVVELIATGKSQTLIDFGYHHEA